MTPGVELLLDGRQTLRGHRPAELRRLDRRPATRHRAAACRISQRRSCRSFPGQFATVRVAGRHPAGHRRAADGGAAGQLRAGYVWTMDADGKAAQRPVETGAWVGKDWIIRSGTQRRRHGHRRQPDEAQSRRSRDTDAGAVGNGHGLRRHGGELTCSPDSSLTVRCWRASSPSSSSSPAWSPASILPLAQYPEIAPPTVVINASYPGASAETIAQTVAAPIEERLSGVENLLYFNSSASSTGDMTITATFDVGTNIDTAVFNVNNRVQLATAASARRSPPQRRHGTETLAGHPAAGLAGLARQQPRHAVPVELRDHHTGR